MNLAKRDRGQGAMSQNAVLNLHAAPNGFSFPSVSENKPRAAVRLSCNW